MSNEHRTPTPSSPRGPRAGSRYRATHAAAGTQADSGLHAAAGSHAASGAHAAPGSPAAHGRGAQGAVHAKGSSQGAARRTGTRFAAPRGVPAEGSGAQGRSGVQAPINAAAAAHGAARAKAGEADRFRRDAAGRAVASAPASEQRGRRAVVAVSVIAGVVLAVLLLVVAGNAVVGALLQDGADTDAVETAGQAPADAAPTATVALVSDGGSIELDAQTYSIISTGDGAYAFACQYRDSSDEPLALFDVTGDPVGFALYQGTFYLVTNADGSYSVQSYVPADGSVPADYQQGEGTVTDLALDGSQLKLTEDTGDTVTIDLPQA